jgi:hypothetical protein
VVIVLILKTETVFLGADLGCVSVKAFKRTSDWSSYQKAAVLSRKKGGRKKIGQMARRGRKG